MSSISPKWTVVRVPREGWPQARLLDFLCARYPRPGRDVWLERLATGRIVGPGGEPYRPDSPCRPLMEIRYRREVVHEEPIPFREEVLFEDAEILVAFKPHFLPVTPAGRYVNECLVFRLRQRTGNEDLVPVHRLDRETAGLVLFVKRAETRARYCRLFERRRVHKVYQALGPVPMGSGTGAEWQVATHIGPGEPWFRRANLPGEPNARTRIRLTATRDGIGLFELEPETGRCHQLRLHLCAIGSHVLNDPLYPELQPEPKADFDRPLQLLAWQLAFRDPVTGESRAFAAQISLCLPGADGEF